MAGVEASRKPTLGPRGNQYTDHVSLSDETRSRDFIWVWFEHKHDFQERKTIEVGFSTFFLSRDIFNDLFFSLPSPSSSSLETYKKHLFLSTFTFPPRPVHELPLFPCRHRIRSASGIPLQRWQSLHPLTTTASVNVNVSASIVTAQSDTTIIVPFPPRLSYSSSPSS